MSNSADPTTEGFRDDTVIGTRRDGLRIEKYEEMKNGMICGARHDGGLLSP